MIGTRAWGVLSIHVMWRLEGVLHGTQMNTPHIHTLRLSKWWRNLGWRVCQWNVRVQGTRVEVVLNIVNRWTIRVDACMQ